jgi:group I intron endonuclease
MICVYGIHNVVTNKWYVGSTVRMPRRFVEHKFFLKHNKHDNKKLQNAYNKYGKDAFEYHILATYDNAENLEHYEILWTIALDALKNGYVLRAGNRNAIGYKHSEETRKKMSDAKKGKLPNNYGKSYKQLKKRGKLSEERKNKISKANKGKTYSRVYKPISDEQKEYLSKKFAGKPRSEEVKRKISETKQRKKLERLLQENNQCPLQS